LKVNEYIEKTKQNIEYAAWVDRDDFETIIDFTHNHVDPLLLEELVTLLQNSNLEMLFWENIISLVSVDSISSNLFDYLVENKIALVPLAHLNLDNNKLEKISKYEADALFTLAKRYYENESYSIDLFCEFLSKHISGEMYEQLTFLSKGELNKKNLLHYFICQTNVSVEIKEEIQKIIRAEELSITNDISKLRNAYEENDSLLLLSISSNFFTPIDILEKLSVIPKVKHASLIRKNSLRQLELKKSIKLHT
jgi:hypothetical protein